MKGFSYLLINKNKSLNLFRLVLKVYVLINLMISQAQVDATYAIEHNRVLTQYAKTYLITCPITTTQGIASDQLYWVDEKNDFNKQDQDVAITATNLLGRALLSININENLFYVSCGYLNNNMYVRIKMWNFLFIDSPTIQLVASNNPSLITLTPINETFSSVSVSATENLNSWTQPIDLIRLKCETNYDYPCGTKFVWMYFYNQNTGLYEIWHKNDLPTSVENVYQIFIFDRYNSLTNRNASLSEFIRILLLDQTRALEFQCAAYDDYQYLITRSINLTLIRGNNYVPPVIPTLIPPIPQPSGSNRVGVIIGAVLGSFFGLCLLLALLGLLLWCCCFKSRRNKNKQTTLVNNQLASHSSGVITYPIHAAPTYVDNSFSNFQNVSNTTANNNYFGVGGAHVDKGSQFSNQIEISNLNTLNDDLHSHGVVARAATVPEVYYRTVTVPTTCTTTTFEEASTFNNVQNECVNLQYEYSANDRHDYSTNDRLYNSELLRGGGGDGVVNGCVDDADFFHHTEKKDYYIHNYNQQQEHEINVHYV